MMHRQRRQRRKGLSGGILIHELFLFKNECNLGVSESYNQLIGVAKGEYLAIMNHGDIQMFADSSFRVDG